MSASAGPAREIAARDAGADRAPTGSSVRTTAFADSGVDGRATEAPAMAPTDALNIMAAISGRRDLNDFNMKAAS